MGEFIMKKNKICLLVYASSFILLINNCLADPVIINNNYNGPTTDPRVPPAGVYTTNTGNGSSQTTYTTGETKPYIVDPPGGNNSNVAPIQPYAWVPGTPGPAPGPKQGAMPRR